MPRSNAGCLSANMSATLVGEKATELQCHLRENESQRTEINGYINQLNIQLHRWQLRLQTLNERNAQLKADLSNLAGGTSGYQH